MLAGFAVLALALSFVLLPKDPASEVEDYSLRCCQLEAGCINDVHRKACDEFGGRHGGTSCNPVTKTCQ